MDKSKSENNSVNRAHDQETQTTFDMNPRERRDAVSIHGTPSADRQFRGHNHRHTQPWGAGHPYYRSSYPDYYPYEVPYPPPPPPPPPPSLPSAYSSHYYQGRTPHWHNPPSPVPQHLTQIPRAHSPFPHYMFPHMDGFYPHHPPTRGMPPPISGPHERRHMDNEIARPKAEWPPGYQPPMKPNVPSDYLATLRRSAGSEYGGPPSTATSLRSTVIDLPHSNFSSPRPSARLSRKRALSNTPSSVESIDLNALIRCSPDSLLGYLGPARVSSAGSFGHLSPIGFCTSPGSRQTPHNPPARGLFITPPPIPTLRLPTPSSMRDTVPSSTTETDGAKEQVKEEPMSYAETPAEAISKDTDGGCTKDEGSDMCHLDSTTSPGTSEIKGGSDNEAEEGQAEHEEMDLSCHWKDCVIQFDSQEALVNHVNSDHIKRERKDFTCYWDGCNREKKPFKAQYMLVVHMRRHTGEKPHKCSYEGCTKAYSRLENLKTHLRSHTGERPYVCEVEGCNKAFSNASDRAKHQNRTHSSVKPYVCKVPGCPKRYTDPSSLRKHTKTVHGEQAIKRLKAEGSREKPPSNPEKKGPPSEKGPTTHDSTSALRSTSHVGSTELPDPQSPGTNSSSSVIQNTNCSHTYAGSCCEGDVVSSTCDRTPGGVDIPSSQGSPRSIGQSTLGVSPRSPPFVNQLPDILESDWERSEGGAVTTMQSIVNVPQSQNINLPKIDNHKRDVAQWVNDVHRRMSESSRRSSGGSQLSAEMAGTMSRRSSQESGWSSYNGSRRSSQASPFPTVSHPHNTQEMTGYHLQVLPQLGMSPQCRPYLHPFDESEDAFRRPSETSTCSNLSAPYNRLSRNSSGYGSQSNLAVIRSPMFHKIPPSSHFPPQRSTCVDTTNRRKSDTIVCEADSSGRYLPKNGKLEARRSSEPVGHVRGGSTRPEPLNSCINREATPMENLNEAGLISDDFDPNELDAYLSPQAEQQEDTSAPRHRTIPAPMPEQTQRLRHFPYPEEQQQSCSQQPPSQTVHHRPQPSYGSMQNPQRQIHGEVTFRGTPLPTQSGCQASRTPQGYWPQQRCRMEQQPGRPDHNNNFHPQGYPTSDSSAYNTALHSSGSKGFADMGNYEDAMVTGMGMLSTNSNGGVTEFVGNGNMVVNDMNTLLNSLLEEEKYLELHQNTRGVTGSAMSIF